MTTFIPHYRSTREGPPRARRGTRDTKKNKLLNLRERFEGPVRFIIRITVLARGFRRLFTLTLELVSGFKQKSLAVSNSN